MNPFLHLFGISHNWLVVSTSLTNMSSSVGIRIRTFPTVSGKSENSMVPVTTKQIISGGFNQPQSRPRSRMTVGA